MSRPIRGLAAALAALLSTASAYAQSPGTPAVPIPGLPHWSWQHPQLTGYDLADIAPLNDSTAVAVGRHGTALKTTDRGRTWRVLSVGTGHPLTHVSFANEQVGWAAAYVAPVPNTRPERPYGGIGEVWKTTNGGTTWVRQQVDNGGVRIWALEAVSPTLVYVAYDELHCTNPNLPCGGVPLMVLAQTTNGGSTWRRISYPAFDTRFYLRFVSATVGFRSTPGAFSGEVSKTTDGGLTWTSIIPDPDPNVEFGALAFPDARHGWLAKVVQQGGTAVNLYRTRDGGQSWTPQKVGFGLGTPSEYTINVAHLAFADTLHGVATGYYGAVFTTADGGQSWQTVNAAAFPDTTLAAAPSAVRAVPGGRSVWATGPAGRVDFSADHGQTWTWTNRPLTTQNLKAVQMLGATDGWATGYSQLLRTRDRGQNWQVVPLPLAPYPRGIVASDFVDRDTGYVAVQYDIDPGDYRHQRGTVLRTTDGGRNWASQVVVPEVPGLPQAPFYQHGTINALRFNAHGHGVLVADSGLIVTTTDGGQTWQPRASGTTANLRGLTWASEQTVYAGGDSVLCRSDDAGLTWQAFVPDSLTVFAPSSVRRYGSMGFNGELRFTSPLVGHQGGGDAVARTVDGGRKWVVVTNPLPPIPQAPGNGDRPAVLDFYGAREGWLFGSENFRTHDGGATWTKTPDVLGDAYGSPVSAIRYLTNTIIYESAATLADAHNAWLVGRNGTILHFSEKFLQADTTLAATPYCAGDSLTLAFTTTGTFGPAEQDFRAELSNPQGRFRAGETTLVGRGAASPLRVRLPATLASGTHYRLRVIRADSSVLGADNGHDLTIWARPTVAVAPADSVRLCAGDSVQLTAPAGYAAYQWSTGATTAGIWTTAAGSYSVQAAQGGGCYGPASAPVVVRLTPRPAAPTITAAPPASGIVVLTSSSPAGNQWFFNGAPISGATSQTYAVTTGAQSGNYTVQVTQRGCASPLAAAVAVNVTRVAGEQAAALVRLVPNPARGSVQVRVAAGRCTGIRLTDLSGRLVATLPGGTADPVVPLTGVAAGTYLLTVTLPGGGSVTNRLVVEP